MSAAHDSHIVLGITGGIAAYKSADLVRRLRDRGRDVRVVMSRGAEAFVTPLTLQAVSGNPVHTSLLDESAEAAMGHIELARWGAMVVVAPATAHFLARLAHGLADDLLTTLCLASAAPVVVAPAMNQQMWRAPATAANLRTLAQRGVRVLGPGTGDQACGDVGPGRMLEPHDIAEAVCAGGDDRLAGLRVIVSAGPTREALDPVRFITNHSTGKMGYAVAAAAAAAGARVTLVSGPTALATPPAVERIDVVSAAEMHAAVMSRVADADIFIGAAAVSDYRPAHVSGQKIKKTDGDESLRLERTADILDAVSHHQPRPFTVGFAAETENLEANARGKLQRKALDLIAANRVGVEGAGFASDDNALTVYWADGSCEIGLRSKRALADRLIAIISERLHAKRSAQGA